MQNRIIKKTIPLITLVVVLAILFFGAFANIAHPLLWNDEGETVMYAQRIREFGYPKISDEKNSIYQLNNPDLNLGAWSKFDAYVSSGWLQYYFATIGSKLAEYTDDIYQATALQRIPFTLMGIIGIILFAQMISRAINQKNKILIFVIFLLFTIISIPLLLHLRQARYYPLLIFLVTTIFSLYGHQILSDYPYKKLANIVLIVLLFLVFNTFWPAYVSILIALVLFNFFENYRQNKLIQDTRTKIKNIYKNLLPLSISIITIVPLIFFYKIFNISQSSMAQFQSNSSTYFMHIDAMLNFFLQYGFFYLATIITLLTYGLILYTNKYNPEKTHELKPIKKTIKISNLLVIFFIFHLLFIALNPYSFERYYIILQPIIIAIILLNSFISWQYLKDISTNNHIINHYAKKIFIFILASLFILGLLPQLTTIKNFTYELTHPYQGPLDYAISYIQQNFTQTDNLIIATNYEELSYMYYLGSKVIIGFIPYNLKNDLQYQPDIIIYRKQWLTNPQIFNYFLQNNSYKQIALPIYDSQCNTIPEMKQHLYKTVLTNNPSKQLTIFVKQ